MVAALARRVGAALSPAVLVAGCLVSFEDYPVGAPGSSDAAAVGGGSGVGGSSGFGGSAASGGAGSGGAAATGGAPSDASPDGAGGSSGKGGSGGSVDAQSDSPLATQCSLAGFWTDPVPPTSAGFVIWFHHPQPLACIQFQVTCQNGPAAVSGLPDPPAGTCPNTACWRATVENCDAGPAHIVFVKDKDLDGTGDCHAAHRGSAGVPVASCDLTVN